MILLLIRTLLLELKKKSIPPYCKNKPNPTITQRPKCITYDRDKLWMMGSLEIRDSVLEQHVTSQISLRFEDSAGRAAHRCLLPRLRGLASRNVAKISEDIALGAERAHPSVLRHFPLGGEHPATVGTVML